MAGSLPEETIRVLVLDRSGQLWLGGDVLGISHTDPAGARFRYLVDDDTSRRTPRPTTSAASTRTRPASSGSAPRATASSATIRASGRFDGPRRCAARGAPAEDQGRPLRVLRAGRRRSGASCGSRPTSAPSCYEPATRQRGLAPAWPGARRCAAGPARARGGRGARRQCLVRHFRGWACAPSPRRRELEPFSEHPRRREQPVASDGHGPARGSRRPPVGRHARRAQPATTRPATACAASRASGSERHSIAGDLVRVIHQSADGTIWIGTHTGLSRLDELGAEDARFSRYLTRDGLPDSAVYGILEEPPARSGYRPIAASRASTAPADASPTTRSNRPAGPGVQWRRRAAPGRWRTRLRRRAGINLFRRSASRDSEFAPPAALTAGQAGGERRLLAHRQASSRSVVEARPRVRLRGRSLDFAAPARNRFELPAGGLRRWLVPLGTRHGSPTPTSTGRVHLLHVRGTNRDGVGAQVLHLRVEVAPPWWMSTPMKLL